MGKGDAVQLLRKSLETTNIRLISDTLPKKSKKVNSDAISKKIKKVRETFSDEDLQFYGFSRPVQK